MTRTAVIGSGRFGAATLIALGALLGALFASPVPASAAGGPRDVAAIKHVGNLESVACPTAKRCIAVGFEDNNFQDGKSVLITASTGTARPWSGALKDDSLNAVACPTKTACVAISDDAVAALKVSTGAMTQTGTLPEPTNGIVALNAVTCASKTSCYAVGFEGSEVSSTAVLAHLSAKGAVLGETTSSARSFSGIACPTSTRCLVGVSKPGAGEIELMRGGHLGKEHALPADTYIRTITCYKADACFALAGTASSGQTNELFPLSPKTGQIGKVVTISGFSGQDVACVTASRCVVIGSEGTGATFRAAVVTVTNKKPGPITTFAGTNLSLFGIACATATDCYAVGNSAGKAVVDRA